MLGVWVGWRRSSCLSKLAGGFEVLPARFWHVHEKKKKLRYSLSVKLIVWIGGCGELGSFWRKLERRETNIFYLNRAKKYRLIPFQEIQPANRRNSTMNKLNGRREGRAGGGPVRANATGATLWLRFDECARA